MYLDPVPTPGRVRTVIAVRRLDAVPDILAELEAAGWVWNSGRKPTGYNPLKTAKKAPYAVVLHCWADGRITSSVCTSEQSTQKMMSLWGSGFRVYQINNDDAAPDPDATDDAAFAAFIGG